MTADERPDYFDAFPTIAMSRDSDGVLLVRLHGADPDTAVTYTAQHHHDWCDGFAAIGDDRDNRAVVLTGTGESFIDTMVYDMDLRTPGDWDEGVYFDGKRMLRRLLDIEVPVIAAVNGPATIHAELAVMSDITLASSTATFQDAPHVPNGTVPGDGVHIVWLELLGINRGRYFLLTGQTLDAQEALRLGVVNEVLPSDQLLERAMEHARRLAALDPVVARYTRVVLTQRYKRLVEEGLGYGLALEGLGALSVISAAGRHGE
ncbi:enoyl-CoA hydratase/isomerase family protein [Pseudonocardia nematodicida]|uniref:Enoyl-CoA hydratase/isomerase family protein n=1 Tax=Pseudonocardia nematodicida TaxID=1206997 RepID=A0ABV1K3P1_9PSEU